MFHQPKTNPITKEHLTNALLEMHGSLVMVEKGCLGLNKQYMETGEKLSHPTWQALSSLHRTLLHGHRDFILTSQHFSTSSRRKRLVEGYAIPTRLWRYGIHLFLELLRHRLPESLDYMVDFIYHAYSIITLLLRRDSMFAETWTEYLGDLGLYRMVVENDRRDKQVWAGVSRDWYKKCADRSPGNGRIQHRLAALACPDGLKQLFHYTRALLSECPYFNTHRSVNILFGKNEKHKQLQCAIVPAFIATHAILFTRGPNKQLMTRASRFLYLLRGNIHQLNHPARQNAYIMCCNFAALLGYGEPDAISAMGFSQSIGQDVVQAYFVARRWFSQISHHQQSIPQSTQGIRDYSGYDSLRSGASLTFNTLSVFLNRIEHSVVCPAIHIALTFIWSLALQPAAMQQLEHMIPWPGICDFLNTLLFPRLAVEIITGDAFPLLEEEVPSRLPDDFLIHGQPWSHLYPPLHLSEGVPLDEDEPHVEDPSISIHRQHRCLWLGVQLAKVSFSPFSVGCNSI